MQIMIVGAGEVGYYLSQHFSSERHDVILIDQNEDKLQRLEKNLDVMTVKGSGASAQVLENAGISKCDLFIAVTDSDEVNLVACMLAREYNVKIRVARVRNEEFYATDAPLNQQRFGLDLMINPDSVMVEEIDRIADLSRAFDVIDFAHGQVELVGYPVEEENPICGKTLIEIGKARGSLGFVIVALLRGKETLIPRGNDVILPGDKMYLVVRRKDLPGIEKFLHLKIKAPRKIFIIGGGRLGLMIAKKLEKKDVEVRMVDSDKSKCQFLSEELDKTIVLNCDGLAADELISEGIGDADLVITTTGNDTTNLLSALLAKHYGARECMTIIERPDFIPLLERLGVDVALSSRILMARAIFKFVRVDFLLSVATLMDTDSEVLELVVPDKKSITGIPLKDLDFPPKSNLGAIVRNNKVKIPTGISKLKKGDAIIVFALKEAIPEVEKFFKA